jgi:Undecaprenyl-phosphate glucose phosphotransferase
MIAYRSSAEKLVELTLGSASVHPAKQKKLQARLSVIEVGVLILELCLALFCGASVYQLSEADYIIENTRLYPDNYPDFSMINNAIKVLPLTILYFYYCYSSDQYTPERLVNPDSYAAGALAWMVTTGVMLLWFYLLDLGSTRWHLRSAVWFSATTVAIFLWRVLVRSVLLWLNSRDHVQRRRVALVGATEQAVYLLDRLSRGCTTSFHRLIGVFDDRLGGTRLPAGRFANQPLCGTTAELIRLANGGGVDMIVIALPHAAAARVRELVTTLSVVPVDLLLCPDLVESALPCRSRQRTAELWSQHAIKLHEQPYQDWRGLAKWVEDKLVAVLALFILWPLMLLIAILILLDSQGPIFFWQERFGFNNMPIRVLKFRTMHQHQADLEGTRQTARNDPRVTRVGRFLRRSSLDELPQLINVLMGDMSIVGPRPHNTNMKILDQFYHELFKHYAARHRVKPGITGLAQVNGLRGEVQTWEKAEQRLNYDLEYIEKWSISLDISIMLKTICKLPFDQAAC